MAGARASYESSRLKNINLETDTGSIYRGNLTLYSQAPLNGISSSKKPTDENKTSFEPKKSKL